jgi:transcriptional regulator GlxA family with amidase domain
LEEQLYEKLYTPQWVEPLINYFTKRLAVPLHADRIAYAAKHLLQQDISIMSLANQVNLSERQFTRVFSNLIGLSPKQFSRIARIHRVLYAPDSFLTLQQLAARHGYHDAAHLTHEFQDLVGTTPLRYFSDAHVLIAQKNPKDDRFLQSESDITIMSSNVA